MVTNANNNNTNAHNNKRTKHNDESNVKTRADKKPTNTRRGRGRREKQ